MHDVGEGRGSPVRARPRAPAGCVPPAGSGRDGRPASGVAREVGALPNTLSTHLTILGHAGLIRSRREGRSIIYSADYDGMRDLLGFLVADCCGGRPEICAPLVEAAQGCGRAP